jgi:elongation factor G
MNVEVIGPEEFQGAAVTMLTRRKGLIINVESNDGWFTLVAESPLNNMFGFSTELRSATQGKGEYSMEYARYAPADIETQERLVTEYQNSLNTDNSDNTKKKGKKN